MNILKEQENEEYLSVTVECKKTIEGGITIKVDEPFNGRIEIVN